MREPIMMSFLKSASSQSAAAPDSGSSYLGVALPSLDFLNPDLWM